MDKDKIKEILTTSKHNGIYCYALTGWEPFLEYENMLELIEEMPEIDLFKIQTNGYIFSSLEKSKVILEEMKSKGFGQNKHIKPTITCSFGLQNKAGLSLDNACYFCRACEEVFADLVSCRLNLTVENEEEGEEYKRCLETRFVELFQKEIDFNVVGVRVIRMKVRNSSLWTKGKGDGNGKGNSADCDCANVNDCEISGKNKIGEMVEFFHKEWDCFGVGYDVNTPLPRMLLRANGDVYACTCFWHVHKAGNVMENSLDEIIERLNQDKTFEILVTWGLKRLYEEVKAKDPTVEEMKLNDTAGACDVCKFLFSKYEINLP